MPLISEIVLSVSVGCVEIRPTIASQEGDEMDSYQVATCLFSLTVRMEFEADGQWVLQERDLERLRCQWLAALTNRQEYLDQHLQSLVSKAGNRFLTCSGQAHVLCCPKYFVVV